MLTTNTIDRVEAALKDRPVRISQCIHLGPPRERAPPGATQAFLKDWVHRAVQIATERIGAGAEKLDLRTRDFEAALREARSSGEGARIIGFLGEPLLDFVRAPVWAYTEVVHTQGGSVMAALSRRKGRALHSLEKVPKTYRLTPAKLYAAQRILGTATTTEAIETALDMVVFRRELVDGTRAMLGVQIDSPEPPAP